MASKNHQTHPLLSSVDLVGHLGSQRPGLYKPETVEAVPLGMEPGERLRRDRKAYALQYVKPTALLEEAEP